MTQGEEIARVGATMWSQRRRTPLQNLKSRYEASNERQKRKLMTVKEWRDEVKEMLIRNRQH